MEKRNEEHPKAKAKEDEKKMRIRVMETPRLLLDYIDTPIGSLALLADDDGCLRALGFTEGHARMERQLRLCHHARDGQASVVRSVVRSSNPGGLSAAIGRFFAGDLQAIADLPVAMGGTPFQRAVWNALREIPCGETRSYGELARRIGNPAAVRAVGLANGANPVGIVIPCHRVIGANGTLTGYAGGVERKRWLLHHEQQAARSPMARAASAPAPRAASLAIRHAASMSSRVIAWPGSPRR